MNATRWILATTVCVLGCALFLACGDQPGRAEADQPAATQPAPPDPQASLARAGTLYGHGNWKEAYDLYRPIVLGDDLAGKELADTFARAVHCLRNLNRRDEIDGFRNAAVAAHGEEWRLLWQASASIINGEHYGYIIAGQFQRGRHRGGGKSVNCFARDRAQALAWMVQAMGHLPKDDNKQASHVSDFFQNLARYIMQGRSGNGAWRLGVLTDLDELPDYDTTGYSQYGGSRGAPVGPDGEPIFYTIPNSWAKAQNDGQRWRWALEQMVEYSPGRRNHAKAALANFLRQQFGVQTIRQYHAQLDRLAEQGDQAETGTWALHTLKDNETIARLATGVKRITLPEEFNFIRLYRELSSNYQLGEIYENRRQYPRAAEAWEKIVRQSNRKDVIAHLDEQDWMWRPDPNRSFPAWNRLAQIRGNLGHFEPVLTQPAGQGAEVAYTFRNAPSVTFTAHEIDIDQLLVDVKAYYRSKPDDFDRGRMSVENVGYRLVAENQTKYLKAKAAEWTLDLDARPNHWDRRITVTTPLQKAGAYLLTARLPSGNTSSVVLWLADLAIVNKPLDDSQWYFVADAVTGEPVENASVEFFGWQRDRVHRKILPDTWKWTYREFDEPTDSDGQVIVGQDKAPRDFAWLTVARTDAGGLAFLGFRRIWYNRRHDPQYHAQRLFTMTDRPVYRPGQPVKFHFWVNVAQYDRTGPSPLADKPVVVRVSNPRGETLYEKSFVLDSYGGAGADLTLPDEAALGMYTIAVRHGTQWDSGGNYLGNSSLRVEEYKKPEYEVSIDAPTEPVALGETVTATIRAEYYFGGPVTEGSVHYKVTRHEHDASWYPPGPWDWLFGPGYWWFAYDSPWYPGWRGWGCGRPVYRWMPWWRPTPPPELVAEDTVAIGDDGTVKVPIDTALAKALFGDRDHRYQITAEVRDASRRTIVGTGQVLVARRPFKVYAWTDRGFYRAGDTVRASFAARRLDGKGVTGTGTLRLLKIDYKNGEPVETEVQSWQLPTDQAGRAEQQLVAASAGQYRLSYTVTDAAGHDIQGGYLFSVWGKNAAAEDYRFNAVELVPDKKHYAPGESVDMRINTARVHATVILFARPTNGVYLPPKTIRLKGRSIAEAIAVTQKDMPNFFVEALTVADGKAHTTVRQIVVPPAKRILDMSVETDKPTYKPGEKATVRIKLTDETGAPFVGAAVLTMYDKAVEYISGGSNVGDIRKAFWQWKRSHQPNTQTSLTRGSGNLRKPDAITLRPIGVFGDTLAREELEQGRPRSRFLQRRSGLQSLGRALQEPPKAAMENGAVMNADATAPAPAPARAKGGGSADDGSATMAQTTVRTKFADTALWAGHVVTDDDGTATLELTMPENLTTWITRGWAMGNGTRVGQATAEAITTKNLLVRIAGPRFLVQGDEVTLSAIVMNRLDSDKDVRVELQLGGELLELIGSDEPGMFDSRSGEVKVPAGGEARVNWRVRAVAEGEAKITVKALTDEESDAMQIALPVLVHGMLKTESISGVVRPDQKEGSFTLRVPEQRRPAESRLEIRYSPTLAMSMIDALPYLVEYPYGCTEQTLNRFVPTVIVQKTLLDMNVDLADVQKKITNLNAQEIGDDAKRAEDWKRLIGTKRWNGTAWVDRNPVFSKAEVDQMVAAGLARLTSMQNGDGGWGWFSGSGEQSYPHTTAVVVSGLIRARDNDVAIDDGVISRGVKWLGQYQAEQVERLKLWEQGQRKHPAKSQADNLDALVAYVLSEAGGKTEAMRRYLYRDRLKLSVYGMCLVGLAMDNADAAAQRDMIIRNIGQYLVRDEENQSAYLTLPESGWWWYWYGSDIETMAFYLKLLTRTDPNGKDAAGLVKYLLNNRRHATYWNSTRDTAYVVEAFADYIRATGQAEPDMTVEVLIDGQLAKRVKITAENLFSFDNTVLLTGEAVTTGEHTITVRRQGDGPVYFNAYLTNFTLEDPIGRAGLEIKVRRKYYKLVPVEKKVHVEGQQGQAVSQRVEKYRRVEIPDPFAKNVATPPVASGDLIEVELILESKNDYEYIVIEDPKAAGCEPTEVRSGYTGNEMGAYVEFRDERVVLFVRRLARGTHSVSYRLFAETPGRFSALPSKARAMYAPELRANSDEQKLTITEATPPEK